tara:strand:+ start:495 stop:788 length:294 start_codon:yes stop_codon:yes gene_type:complete
MKSVEIKNSTKADKKKMAIFYEDGKKIKTVHFGASGMDDYTKTKDKEQRKRYRQRHEKDLKTKDPMKAGYLSYYILWGDSTSLDENIKDYKKRFGFK